MRTEKLYNFIPEIRDGICKFSWPEKICYGAAKLLVPVSIIGESAKIDTEVREFEIECEGSRSAVYIPLNDLLDFSRAIIKSDNEETEINFLQADALVSENLKPHEIVKNAYERWYGDEKFCYLSANIRRIPLESSVFGGLITNLCFRISEHPQKRSHLLHSLKILWDEHFKNRSLNPLSIRWMASSSITLAMHALLMDRDDIFYDIMDKIDLDNIRGEFSNIVYVHECTLRFVKGFMEYSRGSKLSSASHFLIACRSARAGVSDCMSLRNANVINRRFDVDILNEIFYASYIILHRLGPMYAIYARETVVPNSDVWQLEPLSEDVLSSIFRRYSHLGSLEAAFDRISKRMRNSV